MQGRIFQLNTSPGGVPKLAVREAEVTESGLTGDGHNFPEIHGGPEHALCLLFTRAHLAVASRRTSDFPGSTGENVTIVGLDWERLEPGTRLALGDDVQIEITRYTTPCNSMEASFLDGNYARLSQKKQSGLLPRLCANIARWPPENRSHCAAALAAMSL